MANSKSKILDSPETYIGCCCYYCKTCRAYTDGSCKGCKLGYKSGERNIKRAKCKIKLCCLVDKKHETCADCDECYTCKLIHSRFKDYKLRKCLQLIRFINEKGYKSYLKIGNKWKDAYGKLE